VPHLGVGCMVRDDDRAGRLILAVVDAELDVDRCLGLSLGRDRDHAGQVDDEESELEDDDVAGGSVLEISLDDDLGIERLLDVRLSGAGVVGMRELIFGLCHLDDLLPVVLILDISLIR